MIRIKSKIIRFSFQNLIAKMSLLSMTFSVRNIEVFYPFNIFSDYRAKRKLYRP
jgi:hypothetical protein